jgi:hypothetical protein
MLGRKKNSKLAKPFPTEWTEGFNRILNETYKVETIQSDRYFDVYGQISEEELLLIVSYLSEKDEYESPMTLFLSSDRDKDMNEEKIKETQKSLIDIVGLFFDEIFSDSEWNEFEPNWQEVTHKKQNCYYKISRENINLTLEASRLLGPDFEDVETEEDIH